MGSKKDWFTEGFGSAIGDIRRKLVEEGWFGRSVTDKAKADQAGPAESPKEQKQWKPRTHRAEPSLSVSLNLLINIEAPGQQHGHGQDRDRQRSLTHDIDR